ncbi:MAG: helix-turn-helix transcriptional regulator [Caulobacteraceae bacterium]|nr:helix-turn-helix transcriptional regulator [Caulobacteraceae bacterium]
MPASPSDGTRERDEALSSVLRAIRRHRRMTVQQVADLMGLKKRSYERFEAGEGRLKVERIFRFAQVTDADPYALLASVKFGAPDFALSCIDNKLVMLTVLHTHELFNSKGKEIALLRPQAIVEALSAAFGVLEKELKQVRSVSRWLQGSGKFNDTDSE